MCNNNAHAQLHATNIQKKFDPSKSWGRKNVNFMLNNNFFALFSSILWSAHYTRSEFLFSILQFISTWSCELL